MNANYSGGEDIFGEELPHKFKLTKRQKGLIRRIRQEDSGFIEFDTQPKVKIYLDKAQPFIQSTVKQYRMMWLTEPDRRKQRPKPGKVEVALNHFLVQAAEQCRLVIFQGGRQLKPAFGTKNTSSVSSILKALIDDLGVLKVVRFGSGIDHTNTIYKLNLPEDCFLELGDFTYKDYSKAKRDHQNFLDTNKN